MAVPRWNPWKELAEFQEGIIRALEDKFPFVEERKESGEWLPRVDVVETEKEIILYFDLPGVDQKEVEVTISEDRLTVSGERKPGEVQGSFLRRERTFGPFRRSFSLRMPIDVERVVAAYKSGVLEIHLPKFEEGKVKRIRVQEG
ncbi:MAG: Hsp20/alpha crystallin family protein [Candidatus Atribacteria bacterium]|nr:Hsp20/alpha crystallin family protein [Candidatus Atribacteria bacterium]